MPRQKKVRREPGNAWTRAARNINDKREMNYFTVTVMLPAAPETNLST